MAGYIAKNRVETIKGLKQFNRGGYRHSESHSRPGELAFVREEMPPR